MVALCHPYFHSFLLWMTRTASTDLPQSLSEQMGKYTDWLEGLPPPVGSNNLPILKLKYPQGKVLITT